MGGFYIILLITAWMMIFANEVFSATISLPKRTSAVVNLQIRQDFPPVPTNPAQASSELNEILGDPSISSQFHSIFTQKEFQDGISSEFLQEYNGDSTLANSAFHSFDSIFSQKLFVTSSTSSVAVSSPTSNAGSSSSSSSSTGTIPSSNGQTTSSHNGVTTLIATSLMASTIAIAALLTLAL